MKNRFRMVAATGIAVLVLGSSVAYACTGGLTTTTDPGNGVCTNSGGRSFEVYINPTAEQTCNSNGSSECHQDGVPAYATTYSYPIPNCDGSEGFDRSPPQYQGLAHADYLTDCPKE